VNSEFSCGCFLGKLALEIHDSQSHLHERIAKGFDNWTATIKQCLQQDRQRIPEGLDLKTISTFVLTTMERGVMLARAHKSISPFDDAVRIYGYILFFWNPNASARTPIKQTSRKEKPSVLPAANPPARALAQARPKSPIPPILHDPASHRPDPLWEERRSPATHGFRAHERHQ
jgi:Tetracyclin repressor-like, C-terminal domain